MAFGPAPQVNIQAVYAQQDRVTPQAGNFRQIWALWFKSVSDALLLLTGNVGPNQTANTAFAPVLWPNIATLIALAAPTNANAAAAGVPIGGLYTSTANPAPVYVRTA